MMSVIEHNALKLFHRFFVLFRVPAKCQLLVSIRAVLNRIIFGDGFIFVCTS